MAMVASAKPFAALDFGGDSIVDFSLDCGAFSGNESDGQPGTSALSDDQTWSGAPGRFRHIDDCTDEVSSRVANKSGEGPKGLTIIRRQQEVCDVQEKGVQLVLKVGINSFLHPFPSPSSATTTLMESQSEKEASGRCEAGIVQSCHSRAPYDSTVLGNMDENTYSNLSGEAELAADGIVIIPKCVDLDTVPASAEDAVALVSPSCKGSSGHSGQADLAEGEQYGCNVEDNQEEGSHGSQGAGSSILLATPEQQVHGDSMADGGDTGPNNSSPSRAGQGHSSVQYAISTLPLKRKRGRPKGSGRKNKGQTMVVPKLQLPATSSSMGNRAMYLKLQEQKSAGTNTSMPKRQPVTRCDDGSGNVLNVARSQSCSRPDAQYRSTHGHDEDIRGINRAGSHGSNQSLNGSSKQPPVGTPRKRGRPRKRPTEEGPVVVEVKEQRLHRGFSRDSASASPCLGDESAGCSLKGSAAVDVTVVRDPASTGLSHRASLQSTGSRSIACKKDWLTVSTIASEEVKQGADDCQKLVDVELPFAEPASPDADTGTDYKSDILEGGASGWDSEDFEYPSKRRRSLGRPRGRPSRKQHLLSVCKDSPRGRSSAEASRGEGSSRHVKKAVNKRPRGRPSKLQAGVRASANRCQQPMQKEELSSKAERLGDPKLWQGIHVSNDVSNVHCSLEQKGNGLQSTVSFQLQDDVRVLKQPRHTVNNIRLGDPDGSTRTYQEVNAELDVPWLPSLLDEVPLDEEIDTAANFDIEGSFPFSYLEELNTNALQLAQ